MILFHYNIKTNIKNIIFLYSKILTIDNCWNKNNNLLLKHNFCNLSKKKFFKILMQRKLKNTFEIYI